VNINLTTYSVVLCSLLLSTFSFAVELDNGQALQGLSAQQGQMLRYELTVPAQALNLSIAISGGSGDADLYTKFSGAPTTSSYDCRPYLSGNNESCGYNSPSSGTYHIAIIAYAGFSNLTLKASFDGGDGDSVTTLINGATVSALAGSSGEESLYKINIPNNAQDLVISTSGGAGDVDLYVRAGAKPTTSIYDCRPYNNGNNETCTISTPQSGDYYVMTRGWSNYSGVSLSARFTQGGDSGGATWDGFEAYYQNAIGLSGAALESALADLAEQNHNRMSYSQVWDALRYTDEDPTNTNNVLLIYTGRSQSKSFTSSGNNDPDAWNREHSWPKSRGFPSSDDWGYTDIHHLRPSDASVNAARGNKDYDNGGSQISEAPGNYTDSNSFEPRDAVKGDLARMMFYMDIRYNGGDNTGTDDLRLVSGTSTSGARLGDLCTLLAWHIQDPVGEQEITRHARIVERQGNRNPFVDFPSWADQLWGGNCN